MALVTTDRPRVSYADLERWPEDGRRYELYDGEVSVVPSPNLRHQYAVLNIVELLRRYDAEHGGATGLRERGLLQSALTRPLHLATYENPDLAALAAAYAYGITRKSSLP